MFSCLFSLGLSLLLLFLFFPWAWAFFLWSCVFIFVSLCLFSWFCVFFSWVRVFHFFFLHIKGTTRLGQIGQISRKKSSKQFILGQLCLHPTPPIFLYPSSLQPT